MDNLTQLTSLGHWGKLRQLSVSRVAFTALDSAPRLMCDELFPEVCSLVFIVWQSIYRDVVVCIKHDQIFWASVVPLLLFLFASGEDERTFTADTTCFTYIVPGRRNLNESRALTQCLLCFSNALQHVCSNLFLLFPMFKSNHYVRIGAKSCGCFDIDKTTLC